MISDWVGCRECDRIFDCHEGRSFCIREPIANFKPIDMVLHCPACGMQHIDAPNVDGYEFDPNRPNALRRQCWTNPPHRSHLCHGCGHIWRPADVPTNGVAAVKTKGKNDSPIAAELARVTEEAKRYEWLRERMRGTLPMVRVQIMRRGQYIVQEADGLDAAIDAARRPE